MAGSHVVTEEEVSLGMEEGQAKWVSINGCPFLSPRN
jgi:hypothetical protein